MAARAHGFSAPLGSSESGASPRSAVERNHARAVRDGAPRPAPRSFRVWPTQRRCRRDWAAVTPTVRRSARRTLGDQHLEAHETGEPNQFVHAAALARGQVTAGETQRADRTEIALTRSAGGIAADTRRRRRVCG
jgi:hypothetical protein